MGAFKDFEEIEAWQESRKLLRAIREITHRDKVKRDFDFIDQITRSARSISTNIAEGSDSMTRSEFIQLLGYAKRSCSEVRAHLYDALDENYISQEEFKNLSDQTKKICSMLAKLIHYLQSIDRENKRTHLRGSYRITNNE